jgi:hypothetical protein
MTTPPSVGAEPLIRTTYKESSVNVDDKLRGTLTIVFWPHE